MGNCSPVLTFPLKIAEQEEINGKIAIMNFAGLLKLQPGDHSMNLMSQNIQPLLNSFRKTKSQEAKNFMREYNFGGKRIIMVLGKTRIH